MRDIPRELLGPLVGRVALLVLLAALASSAWGSVDDALRGEDGDPVARAVVTLDGARCQGTVVGDRHTVLTAAHCVLHPRRPVRVELSTGQEVDARVQWIHRRWDLALLHLPEPAPVEPLAVATELPDPGAALWFPGTERSAPQRVAVRRLGRCPSLPCVPRALYTDLHARRGDSGAPLVDEELRVVGVVHGGARCRVAAPTARVGRLVEDGRHAAPVPAGYVGPCAAPSSLTRG